MSQIPNDEISADEDGNLSMSVETLKALTGYVEEADDDEAAGKKNYCCVNAEDGREKDIRARNSFFAAVKCMAHYSRSPRESISRQMR